MPAFRTIAPIRHSARLVNHVPVINDLRHDRQIATHTIKNEAASEILLPLSSAPSTPGFEDTSCDVNNHHPLSPSPFDAINTTATVRAKRPSHARRREPGHIPRPCNAFILFRSEFVSGAYLGKDEHQNELSRSAGKVWNNMSKEEKEPYRAAAEAQKREHKARNPEYRYNPGRVGRAQGAKVTKKSSKAKRGRALEDPSPFCLSPSGSSTTTPSSPVQPSLFLPAHATEKYVAHEENVSVIDGIQYPGYVFSDEQGARASLIRQYKSVAQSSVPAFCASMEPQEHQMMEVERNPLPPFHPHLDPVTGPYAYQNYTYDFTVNSLPTLPHIPSTPYDAVDSAVHVDSVLSLNSTELDFDFTSCFAEFSLDNTNLREGVSAGQCTINSNAEEHVDSLSNDYNDRDLEQSEDALFSKFFNFDQ